MCVRPWLLAAICLYAFYRPSLARSLTLSPPLLSRKSVYSESLSLLSPSPPAGLCLPVHRSACEDRERDSDDGGLLCFSLSLSLLLSHTASGDVIGPWPTRVLLDGPHGSGCTLAVVLSPASRVPLLRVKRRAKGREHTPCSVAYIGPGRRRGRVTCRWLIGAR
jgi:hypothetical protein